MATYRPLVVIDPEDREQVERFAEIRDALYERMHPGEYADTPALDDEVDTDLIQAALREFANPTPPKPDEPTGLGAVVEDADGNRWVLYTHPDSTSPWCDGSTSVDWDEITAVRVLSEGVQA